MHLARLSRQLCVLASLSLLVVCHCSIDYDLHDDARFTVSVAAAVPGEIKIMRCDGSGGGGRVSCVSARGYVILQPIIMRSLSQMKAYKLVKQMNEVNR